MTNNMDIIELNDEDLGDVVGGASACGCNNSQGGISQTGDLNYGLADLPTVGTSAAAGGWRCLTVCWRTSNEGPN